MSVSIKFDYNNVMAEVIGPRHGLTLSMLEGLQDQARAIDRKLRRLRAAGKVGFFDLADSTARKAELDRIAALAERIASRFRNFVVLGIGGSALGPICVQRALGHLYYNLRPRRARNRRPRIFVLDNADPELLAELLDVADPAETCFDVITKSGETPETISQFMAYYELVVARVGRRRAAKHFVVTTEDKDTSLRRTAERLGMEFLPLPANVGGRFSELTAVGLLPAAVAGIEIRRLVAGAEAVAARCRSADLFENPAYLNAAIHYLADVRRGKKISVLMPYSEALRDVADWYRQLWAESLGKRRGRPPNEVLVGQTPVRALGATDQHSQLQLYRDGPNDKIVTFIEVEQFRRTFRIGTILNEQMADLAYLAGEDIAKLLRSEMRATEFSLAQAERPSVRITLARIDAEHIGGLLFFFMIQTAFAGGLYGVDAFNQPGVEESKQATAALMGRSLARDRRMRRSIEKYEALRSEERVLKIES